MWQLLNNYVWLLWILIIATRSDYPLVHDWVHWYIARCTAALLIRLDDVSIECNSSSICLSLPLPTASLGRTCRFSIAVSVYRSFSAWASNKFVENSFKFQSMHKMPDGIKSPNVCKMINHMRVFSPCSPSVQRRIRRARFEKTPWKMYHAIIQCAVASRARFCSTVSPLLSAM